MASRAVIATICRDAVQQWGGQILILAHVKELLEQAVDKAHRAARLWAGSSHAQRRALLEAVADRLDSERDRLAGLITAEMGKLSTEARAEVEKCAWVCRYYAEHAESFLADERIDSDARPIEVNATGGEWSGPGIDPASVVRPLPDTHTVVRGAKP